ncbi:MAG: ribonuclease HII [Candidatus Taylorbacteria bacterium]|nr:ribonuclease HII [Candidatus Taylorbacteria bacterium]
MKNRYLIGIDEAGRGPLAGPVAVGVFAVKSRAILRKFHGVKDSKQLSEKQREEWFRLIRTLSKKGEAFYAVSFSRPETIDAKGLSYAIYSALNRSLRRLEIFDARFRTGKILLDGSLHASDRYEDQTTIIDGDAKEPIIALASICAKVLRDRRMVKAAKQFPGYGFEIHKGYGTKVHYKALKKHGMTPIHRRSFLRSLHKF